MKILIVDDSPLLRRSLRTFFEQELKWSVCGEAVNGRDGIDKASQLRPDLIVMDLVMPSLNGIEATRMIKRLLPSIPMFTTFTDSFLTKEALSAGVDAVVAKIEGATTLIHSIKRLIVTELPAPANAA